MYMRFGFLAGLLPAGKTWVRIDLEKAGKGLGVDLNQLIGGAAQNPTRLARPAPLVGATSPRSARRRSAASRPRTTTGSSTSRRPPQRAAPRAPRSSGCSPSARRRSIRWTSGSTTPGCIRRFSQSYDQELGGKAVSLETTMDMSDYGPTVDVSAPPADQVFDATALAPQGAQSQSGATTTTSTVTARDAREGLSPLTVNASADGVEPSRSRWTCRSRGTCSRCRREPSGRRSGSTRSRPRAC